ncbi:unnamed protein product [Schistosoma bovis]|uniref:DDB1- and CUL4-associated factor 15 WD40 repeat-containing domain-containing protein n=1 Tax=Schistosoma bovis TaxID=6184 RepID=A0A430QJP5_SCHBO|nr:uncharacterized protein DC041_0010427 [Schistosoma bovis]CAH8575501.1 unnamed protein product [Schistosoma bovis]CAH8580090.1 unnamed protein product [Schistosoma bovis]
MIRWLQNRELTSIHNVLSMDLSCVLKPYHLRQILPPDASDDIFLGFSADGCFLISYKNDFKHHVIRFWLFPPRSTGNLGPKLALYSERKFLRTSYCPDLHNVPCVRFVQSLAVSNSFLLLACNNDGSGFVAAFGLMPDIDCDICSEASSAHDRLSNKSTCSIHSHVLPLNLDISFAQESPIPIRSNRNSLKFQKTSYRCTSHFVPPCLSSFDENSCSNNADLCGGSCFTSTGLPIGRIHVGVSPNTGHLRIAWANPDAQVKIMSCSFKPSTNSGDFSFCTLPKGTSTSIGNYPESLIYKPPLITHNYCSTCYSWPDENELCQEKHNSSVISRLNSSKCIFSQDSLNVYLVSDASAWPDNHSNLLPDGAERIYHNCSGEKYSHDIHSSKLYVKSRILPDTWVPSLLSRRSCFFSCILLTYLAMLQDIRASYLHWTLVSRNNSKMNCLINSSDLMYPIYQNDPVGDYDSDLNGNNSSISSSHGSSDDDETAAMVTSPDSLDSNSSPEDLLVHRLSGQCHTSFDLTEWEEYIAPNVQTVISDVNSNFSRISEKTQRRVFAHLEEVVFDIPLNRMLHEKKCTHNSSSPILAPFFPPDEPDLLLVYYIKNNLDSNLYETSEEFNAVNLIEIIDVTTGYRIPIPSINQSSCEHTCSTGFSSSVLNKLTSCCPQNYKVSSSHYRKKLVHELNNCLMAGRLESLKLLVDPQGGYSVYW